MPTAVSSPLRLPSRPPAPGRVLVQRMLVGLGLIVFVALVAYVDRDGYRDAAGNAVSLLDCFYYATVSITTTGYGDVIPVTDTSRLLTTLRVTPARIVFLILLVGTTVEVLAEGSRHAIRLQIWRRRLRDHIIVCGFGTKGRNAIETLTARGTARERIVVIDAEEERVAEATRAGFPAVHGNATRSSVLEEAGVATASAVVVAADTDEAAVLITLTARELNPTATIVSAVREDENRHLLHQSGADSAIISSAAAGRLLGFATHTPRLVEVLEDLLSVGEGLDIVEREVADDEVGRPLRALEIGAPVIALVRGEELLRFDDPRTAEVQRGDRIVSLCSI
ncbi:MAG TPA: potassium channel family protein [Solirubrobacteraceae bacterium]|nr:potassium channel family protein [Solirubrobacteraceae bacterium]